MGHETFMVVMVTRPDYFGAAFIGLRVVCHWKAGKQRLGCGVLAGAISSL